MPYIDEATLKIFEKKISKINNKLIKNGIEPITYDVNKKVVSYANLRGFCDGSKNCVPEWHTLMYEVFDIKIHKDIAIPETGWTLVAIINHTDHFITHFDESIDIEHFRNNTFCDHCKTKRVRNTTLVIKNENGELKSIGKSCAKDFFGHDLSCWLNKLSWYNWNPGCFQEDYENFIYSFSDKQMYKCSEVISLAYSLISQYGFVASSNENSTKELMLKDIHSNIVTDEDRNVAQKIVEWAKNTTDDCSFMCNVRSIFSNEYVSTKVFGFIAASVKKYLEPEKEKTESNFIGNIGDKKVKFENVTYKGCYSFINTFAFKETITYIHKFVDDNGNIIIWKTGKYILEKYIEKKINFTATIKDHKIYKNVKQTIISHVKI